METVSITNWVNAKSGARYRTKRIATPYPVIPVIKIIAKLLLAKTVAIAPQRTSPTTTTSINVTSATSLNRIVKPSIIHINVNVTLSIVTFTFMWMTDGFTIRFNDVADVTFIEVVVVGIDI